MKDYLLVAGLGTGTGAAGVAAGAGVTGFGAGTGAAGGTAEFEDAAGTDELDGAGTAGEGICSKLVEVAGNMGDAGWLDAVPGLDSASSNAPPLAGVRCRPMMASRRANPKKMPAEYLVMVVSAVPDPAPKSASAAEPPNAMPAPASFLGTCTRIKSISTMQFRNMIADKNPNNIAIISFFYTTGGSKLHQILRRPDDRLLFPIVS